MHAPLRMLLVAALFLPAADPAPDATPPAAHPETASADASAAKDLSQLIAELKSRDLKTRVRAAIACEKLGPKAAPATAALIEVLGDERHATLEPGRFLWAQVSKLVQDYAVAALAAIGPSTVPALVEAFETGDEDTRDGVVKVLGRFGPEVAAALPVLRRALDDPDREVRVNAVEGLGALGPAAKEALPKVAHLAENDPHHAVRSSTVEALARIAGDGNEVVPHLRRLLDDEYASIRQWAITHLAQAKPDPEKLVPLLIGALDDEDPGVRAAAIESLTALGPNAAPATGALVALLDDETLYTRTSLDLGGLTMTGWQFPVRDLVPDALAAIGPGAKAALPALRDLMRSGDHVMRRLDAAVALRRVDPQDEEPIAYLVGLLEENEPGKDNEYRRVTAAAETLAELGPLAAPAVGALLALLDHEDDHVRWSGIRALGSIGPAAKEVLSELIRVMRSDDSWVGEAAAKAILEIDPGNVEAGMRLAPSDERAEPDVPGLLESLKRDEAAIRAAACAGLGRADDESAVGRSCAVVVGFAPPVSRESSPGRHLPSCASRGFWPSGRNEVRFIWRMFVWSLFIWSMFAR